MRDDIDYTAPIEPAIPVWLCGRPGCFNELTETDDGMTCEICGAEYDTPSGHAPAPPRVHDDGD